MTKEELQQKYNNLAAGYSQGMWVENYIFGVQRLRASLMVKATGKVLDVACGTGENFPFFKSATDITAIDLSPQMLDTAHTRRKTKAEGRLPTHGCRSPRISRWVIRYRRIRALNLHLP